MRKSSGVWEDFKWSDDGTKAVYLQWWHIESAVQLAGQLCFICCFTSNTTSEQSMYLVTDSSKAHIYHLLENIFKK